MKVDVMIIGAQKCATTSLFELMVRHPGIVGSRPKEPHFFSTCHDWRSELPRYEAMFTPRDGAIYLEGSTSYTFYPRRNLRIWEDLYEYNPSLRFVYLVRNPVDRIVSHYMHSVERGFTKEPIERAIVQRGGYLAVSRYATQIRPFLQRFGRDQVLLLDFDDFVHRRAVTLRSVSDFIGLDLSVVGDPDQVHANRSIGGNKQHHRFDDPPLPLRVLRRALPAVWDAVVAASSPRIVQRPQLSVDHRRMIVDMLELEIAAMEELMGKDLSAWRRIEDDAHAGATVATQGTARPRHAP